MGTYTKKVTGCFRIADHRKLKKLFDNACAEKYGDAHHIRYRTAPKRQGTYVVSFFAQFKQFTKLNKVRKRLRLEALESDVVVNCHGVDFKYIDVLTAFPEGNKRFYAFGKYECYDDRPVFALTEKDWAELRNPSMHIQRQAEICDTLNEASRGVFKNKLLSSGEVRKSPAVRISASSSDDDIVDVEIPALSSPDPSPSDGAADVGSSPPLGWECCECKLVNSLDDDECEFCGCDVEFF